MGSLFYFFFFFFLFVFNLQFGKGIYFADLVSKSAQYCYTDRNNPVGLMILSEVALGEVYELKKAEVNSIFIVFVRSCVFLELIIIYFLLPFHTI